MAIGVKYPPVSPSSWWRGAANCARSAEFAAPYIQTSGPITAEFTLRDGECFLHYWHKGKCVYPSHLEPIARHFGVYGEKSAQPCSCSRIFVSKVKMATDGKAVAMF